MKLSHLVSQNDRTMLPDSTVHNAQLAIDSCLIKGSWDHSGPGLRHLLEWHATLESVLKKSWNWLEANVDITIINHPFGNGYKVYTNSPG